jgi:hypothetical protein
MAITRFDLTIPAGAVGSDLTSFVTRVDLADMPAEFWAAVDVGGGYIRVKQGASVIPFDVVDIDTGTDTGSLYFRYTLNTLTDNEFEIIVDTSLTALAATDPNGRNDCWQDYEAVYIFEGDDGTDRTGNGHSLTLNSGAAIASGKLTLGGTGDYATASIPIFTDWTMAVTCTPSSVGAIETVLAQEDASSTITRTAIVQNTGTQWECWNLSNGVLAYTGGAPANGTRTHLVSRQLNTTERTADQNGSTVTDVGCDQRPGGSAPVNFNIGCATLDPTEEWHGDIFRAYLRDGYVSSDWVDAEYVSWETPSSFYNAITLIPDADAATVFKTTAYSVLDRMETADVFKTTAYSVLAPGADGARAYKTTAYSVLAPNEGGPEETYKYSYLPVVN